MSDLLALAVFFGAIWWIISSYTKKWKLENPGKPAFEWVERQGSRASSDNASGEVMAGPNIGKFDYSESIKW